MKNMSIENKIKKELANLKGLFNEKDTVLNLESFAEYKKLSSRKVDAIKIVRNWISEINNKRNDREDKKPVDWKTYMTERHIAKWEEWIRNNFKLPANYSLHVHISDNFNYTTHHYLDWNGYANSCRYPMHRYDIYFDVPRKYTPKMIQKKSFDGLLNIKCKNIAQMGLVGVYEVVYFKSGRGYEGAFKSCYVVSNGTYHYHAENVKLAIDGLKKKIKRSSKRYEISVDSYISKKKYHDITGACYEGIEEWCSKNGINPDSRMKVKELIPILKKDMPYGAEKILSMIQ